MTKGQYKEMLSDAITESSFSKEVVEKIQSIVKDDA